MGDAGDRDDDLARLVRLAGRSAVEPARAQRVERAVRTAWRRESARARRTTALVRFAAVAAAAALVAAVLWSRHEPQAAATVDSATAATVHGRELIAGEAIAAGATIHCGSGRVALRLPGGHSLRLDHDTVVRLARGAVELESGAAYVDHSGEGGDGLRLRTPYGEVIEHGTQFEARLTPAGLRVRVREGRIVLATDAARVDAEAGEQLVLDPRGAVARARVASDDAGWGWVAACAPAPRLEGATAAIAIAWACREHGWTPDYATAAARRAAEGARLRGLPPDVAADEVLDYILSPSGLAARRDAARLVVSTANASPEIAR